MVVVSFLLYPIDNFLRPQLILYFVTVLLQLNVKSTKSTVRAIAAGALPSQQQGPYGNIPGNNLPGNALYPS
jgi:hypothetical protein